MPLQNLQHSARYHSSKKLKESFENYQEIIQALEQRELKQNTTELINSQTEAVNTNATTVSDKKLYTILKKAEKRILKILESKEKITAKNHYRNLWLALGMSAFGIPLGVAISIASNNWGMVGVGLPIGMGIGIGFGASLDKKAQAENRQLDVEIKS